MPGEPDLKAVCGRWIHSREEDTPDEMVFRPPDFAFPPSRGRAGIELRSDNACIGSGIGATDVGRVRNGQWHVDETDDRQIRIDFDDGREVMVVTSVAPDKLTIRKRRGDTTPFTDRKQYR